MPTPTFIFRVIHVDPTLEARYVITAVSQEALFSVAIEQLRVLPLVQLL